MGSASSKFRKHLQNGDEVAALQLYGNNSDLRKGLDPNCSYGDSHQHETPLHFAGRHGMRSLLRIFLYEKGGNPNKTNAKKETSLHCVCMENNARYYNVRQRRADCLLMVLKWRGATLQEGEIEKVNLASQDEKNNTALHYAASSGLKKCVELLVQYGAPLFIENQDNLTPCDCADKNGNSEIALYLESKMVFSSDGVSEDEDNEPLIAPVEEYCGLRAQDLQEAKDQLLVETADMLSVPLFTAEALLRNHEWSRETLLESWMSNPFACCEKSGVTPPQTLISERPDVPESFKSPLSSPCKSEPPSPDAECDICASSFLISDEPVQMTCGHDFCRECWETYLNLKIQEGDAHHITCPAYDCTKLVPVDVIENVVSRDMARRYLQFDIKAFVDSNPDMKWCPYPGCARAVKLPDLDNSSANPGRMRIPSDTSRGGDCGNGHYFCWECYGDSHEPCSCQNWVKWTQKIAEIKPEQLNGTDEETESAANCLWLVTNSKACPNCKSPIQKNEGCNHMKCSKCKYDFCWVCLEQWKRHNSSTGGYFKCNRYEAVKKVEDKTAQMVSEAEERNTKMQELNRFVHYYTRFKNHENSYKLEEPLLKTAKDKMMKLAEAVTDSATANAETKFVEDAVHQLLKARRVLRCSYVYAFYLDGPGYKKIVFEFMQTELEECTEILSQMVNRLYLRTPRKKIIDQAHVVKRKRLEFITAISKGLVPPETPPSLRKKRKKKYSMEMEDEDLRKAILASIQDVDPANPWIKDASGRHTNVMAYLDWPADDSDDSDAELTLAHLRIHGKCHRTGCTRPRAPNPRTGEIHNYCSLYCQRCDEEEKLEQEQSEEIPEVILDEHMDLLRALEMSRLQFLRDAGLIHVPDRDSEVGIVDKSKEKSPVRPRSNSESLPMKSDLTPMEKLDQELQRVLDLSSTINKDSESPVTLQVDVPMRIDTKCSGQHNRKFSGSRFEETMSTLVPRVPNKSVEDLYCVDATLHPPTCSCDKCVESLGAYAGAGVGMSELESDSPTSDSNTFGIIKDLSVSNIHAFEDDKTREFLSKDFASLFHKTQLKLLTSQTSCKNGGKILAANTPIEDDSVAGVLASPQSDMPATTMDLWRPCTTSSLSNSIVSVQSDSTNFAEVANEQCSSTGVDIMKTSGVEIQSIDIEMASEGNTETVSFKNETKNNEDLDLDENGEPFASVRRSDADLKIESSARSGQELHTESATDSSLDSAKTPEDSGSSSHQTSALVNECENYFTKHSSLLEMAENLVQMTEAMSYQIQATNIENYPLGQTYESTEDCVSFVEDVQSVLDIVRPCDSSKDVLASGTETETEKSDTKPQVKKKSTKTKSEKKKKKEPQSFFV